MWKRQCEVLRGDREESQIKGFRPNEEKNGLSVTKRENIGSREVWREEKWV